MSKLRENLVNLLQDVLTNMTASDSLVDTLEDLGQWLHAMRLSFGLGPVNGESGKLHCVHK